MFSERGIRPCRGLILFKAGAASWAAALAGQARQAVRFDRAQLSAAAGLRAALTVVAPLVVNLAINHLLQGLAVAIGALIMGAVSLSGGAGRHATAGLRRRVRARVCRRHH
jgi:hypothetical protein